MPIVGLALALFAGAFALHVILWRAARPAATMPALLVLFAVAVPAGLLAVLAAARALPGLAAALPADPFGLALALVLALALAAGYVMTYPAIEVESPTLAIVQAIARRGERGLARADLFEQLNDQVLVAPRVRDLMRDGLAVETGGRLRLGPRGRRLVAVFAAWRRVLGAGAGG